MAVLDFREVIPRTYEHKLGGSPTASRVFTATVDAPTETSLVLQAIGISHGDQHPDHSSLQCDGISADESDRHHVTVTYSYAIPDPKDPSGGGGDGPPWLQPDRWSFSTTNSSVACTTYYPRGFNDPIPLINTAGDVIVGLTKAEAELRISISGSRLQLDLQKIKKYINTINKTAWCGFPKHTVQLVGVSASPDRLEWMGAAVDYWQVTTELLYRSTTHNLCLPNVGWNVIINGKKRAAWTFIKVNGEIAEVPAPHPVALNDQGGFKCPPERGTDADYVPGSSSGSPSGY